MRCLRLRLRLRLHLVVELSRAGLFAAQREESVGTKLAAGAAEQTVRPTELGMSDEEEYTVVGWDTIVVVTVVVVEAVVAVGR